MRWIKAVEIDELAPGEGRPVTLAGEEVLLCRLENGGIFGVADSCSHDGASFQGGSVDGTRLTCPRHGAQFDLMSGKALKMPAVAPIETFPIRVTDDGWIEVEIEEA
jgi:3-phenylpropionate/trans-cinnamate dioxygenase ferredoxin component